MLLSCAYDLNGNRIRQSGITGKTTSYTYNALDLLEEIRDNEFRSSYSYNSNYQYDRQGNLLREERTIPNSITPDLCNRFCRSTYGVCV